MARTEWLNTTTPLVRAMARTVRRKGIFLPVESSILPIAGENKISHTAALETSADNNDVARVVPIISMRAGAGEKVVMIKETTTKKEESCTTVND
mmetsp:Transcript_7430/g.11176  ORF Transcript_7430/g.11176 Transcript_7430/m.11176 type:complete len:95 (+) Transcript_7430:1230-1514(+)